MNRSDNSLNYLPGLDGIRALAAFLVILTHWPNLMLSIKFGWIGVNIFFVLSGFLITRILIHQKPLPVKPYFYGFFYKRILRIFPVYYLVFLITAVLLLLVGHFSQLSNDPIVISGTESLKHDYPFLLSYTYNIELNLSYFFKWTEYSSGFFGHFWSLAAEEQFYIIFPFLVYFLQIQTLKKVVIIILVACPLIRLWAATMGDHLVTNRYWLGEFIYTNTFCQADALALGAAIALFKIKYRLRYLFFFLTASAFLLVGITVFYYLRKAGYFLVEGNSLGFNFPGYWFDEKTPWALINVRAVYQYMLVNLLAFSLIAPATFNKPIFPRIFEWKPVKYLGKISYGVYLIHAPILTFFKIAANYLGGWYNLTTKPLAQIGVFAVYLTIVITLAHLSYKYFERRIIGLYKPALIQKRELTDTN